MPWTQRIVCRAMSVIFVADLCLLEMIYLNGTICKQIRNIDVVFRDVSWW